MRVVRCAPVRSWSTLFMSTRRTRGFSKRAVPRSPIVPKSNGKLAAGFAPMRTLLDAGLTVGLGTDSVASNNAADLFEEMRAAVFTARSRGNDVQALGARDASGWQPLAARGARAGARDRVAKARQARGPLRRPPRWSPRHPDGRRQPCCRARLRLSRGRRGPDDG